MMISILLGLLAGLALGAVYFGGLWWTVKKVTEEGGAMTLVASFLVRAAVVLVGFYLVLQAGVFALGAALVAFVGVRMVSTRRLAPASQRRAAERPATEKGAPWS